MVRRKEVATLPASLVEACEAAVLRDTGLAMPLWEKCLVCGEKLKCCSWTDAERADESAKAAKRLSSVRAAETMYDQN